MPSRDAELRRRETALAARADRLREWELRLGARESELSARRARWGAAWRLALAPARALQLILGGWLAIGATALGGTALVVSAVACGLVLATMAVARMSLPRGMQEPRTGVLSRLRARLAHAATPAPPVDTTH
jgi:hypothetical protein